MARGLTNFSKSRQVDKLSPADIRIFQLASRNANYFTDHYIRTEGSGTYWRNGDPETANFDPDRQRAWEIMREKWAKEGMPDGEWIFGALQAPIKYIVQYDPSGEPTFHHHHGWLFQPWQLQVHHSTQPDVTVISGVGAGKTGGFAISSAVIAATVPNARIFCIAPQMMQTMEAYNYLITTLEGTEYWNRFVWRHPTRPTPKIEIRNSLVGSSTIEFYSIEDDPRKVLTLEGDWANLDQAEKFEDLEVVEAALGSRLRGSVRGRPRLGKMVFWANSGDNPQLWNRFDLGDPVNGLPKFYLSLAPHSEHNPYLSKTDIANLKRRVGGTEEEADIWMHGKRPLGSGEHFNAAMVKLCTSEELEKLMDDVMNLPDDDLRKQGFVHKKSQELGTYQWEMPPQKNRDYIVISDPGQGNPPYRNSAAVMVFDVTEFPEQPMKLRAFNWIFGMGSYWPWLRAHAEYVEKYHAYGRNAFDATGTQKGFDELVFHEMKLGAEGMDMSGTKKMLSINALKLFMGKGMIEFPYIVHLSSQLTHYKLPDDKIRQDLVSCLAMAANWARRLYWTDIFNESEDPKSPYGNSSEYDRYARQPKDRYDRPTTVHR